MLSTSSYTASVSHILFIRNEPSIPDHFRDVFLAPANRVVVRRTGTEVESAIDRGAFDISVIYSESGADSLTRCLQSIRRINASLNIIVIAPQYDLSEEHAAFENGADLYFSEPIPPQTLKRILHGQGLGVSNQPKSSPVTINSSEVTKTSSTTPSTLHVLRDLSQILSYSLDYKAFTQQFILKLRDYISFSRIAIFLENSAKQSLVKNVRARHLSCIASLGLPSDLIDCFQLSKEFGIGQTLDEHPRIVHKGDKLTHSPFGSWNSAIEKEFSVLGCHLAIPITDREGSMGVAVINGPVTGRAYAEDELELLYLLMEELGLAIRNSRLHNELAHHGQLIENVMHSMASGAIVFSEELDIIYINDAAKNFLGIGMDIPGRPIGFGELPASLAAPVHRAVENGELPEPFKIPGHTGNRIYRVSVFPFSKKDELLLLPRPTMIILEDYTMIEANTQMALADSRSELIGLIAERFAHEIRNSLVPLSAHAQLIDKKIEQPKFQASLKAAMLKETARIKRFSDQMLYLAQNSESSEGRVELIELIEVAFERARSQVGNESSKLDLDGNSKRIYIAGNSEALTHAFEEIFLNSLQAQANEQSVQIALSQNKEGILSLCIRDGGPGLKEEVVSEAIEPFYTTRNTGIGLGLSVANKVVTEHKGYLHLNVRTESSDWDIKIELPILFAK